MVVDALNCPHVTLQQDCTAESDGRRGLTLTLCQHTTGLQGAVITCNYQWNFWLSPLSVFPGPVHHCGDNLRAIWPDGQRQIALVTPKGQGRAAPTAGDRLSQTDLALLSQLMLRSDIPRLDIKLRFSDMSSRRTKEAMASMLT
ncbi:hypothetical protein ElyMa_001840400 [Elysia marginata]|uniref:SRCR domain-containing protein n=1 Tax=Elysia marginata TaxID=1093978 RepID=A0AAV4EL47_9GAST|nr:hypothetical protein ElyMa_001840400 [Elysia marginata]